MRSFRASLPLLACLTLTIGLVACQPAALQRTTDTSRSMADVGDALKRLVPTLAETSTTIEQIATVESRNATADLPNLYRQFSREVDQFQTAFAKAEAAAQSADKSATDYLDERRKANMEIADPSLRSIDETQIESIHRRLQDALATFESLKGEFTPLASSLTSLRTYLANNLNAAGVKSAAGQFSTIGDQVRGFQPKVNECIETFQQLATSMVPPKK
jgi:chromosome segregation ATPase